MSESFKVSRQGLRHNTTIALVEICIVRRQDTKAGLVLALLPIRSKQAAMYPQTGLPMVACNTKLCRSVQSWNKVQRSETQTRCFGYRLTITLMGVSHQLILYFEGIYMYCSCLA